ncbi:hypothetical protein NL676_022113 [Syzygium grande]|nr:hypothetical protein NL676_022113 [Syzygium grande]
MAPGRLMVVLAVVVVVAVALAGGSEAITLCKMSDDQLMACKPAVTNPNPAEPTTECCTGLSAADLSCLCSVVLLLPPTAKVMRGSLHELNLKDWL